MTDMANKKGNICVLRIIATLAVILLHTCNAISNNSEKYTFVGNQFFVLTSIESLMNWSVPVFLMISGSLLIKTDTDITYDIVLKKYCRRILLALMIFGVPFALIKLFSQGYPITIQTILESFLMVCKGNSWGHLWYLYILLELYLVLPVINTFVNYSSRKTVLYFEIILFLIGFIIPILFAWFQIGTTYDIPFGLAYAVFYFILGKYLSDSKLKNNKRLLFVFLVVCTGLILLVNFFIGNSGTYLYYNSPLVAGMAVCLYLLIKECNVNAFIWKLDRACFGAYLIHPLFINFVYKYLNITPLCYGENYYLLYVFIFWVGFVIAAFYSSFLMSYIPLLKKYVL